MPPGGEWLGWADGVSPVVSIGVSGAVLGRDAPVQGFTAGQAVDEAVAGEGDCISVQQSIPIYLTRRPRQPPRLRAQGPPVRRAAPMPCPSRSLNPSPTWFNLDHTSRNDPPEFGCDGDAPESIPAAPLAAPSTSGRPSSAPVPVLELTLSRSPVCFHLGLRKSAGSCPTPPPGQRRRPWPRRFPQPMKPGRRRCQQDRE